MEELFEIWTWSALGRHTKPVGLINVNGYYDGLLAFLDRMQADGFVQGRHREMLFSGEDVGEVLARMTVSLDDAAKQWLAEKGYDPAYGARPLKRVIQKELQDPLARLILEGAINDGEAITVSAEAGALTINGRAVGRSALPPAEAVIQ